MSQIKTITLNPAFDLHYYMEQFLMEKENYAKKVLSNAGGKGINTSRTLTANEVENDAYVILGKENCIAFEAQLNEYKLHYFPVYVNGRIRENITIHPPVGAETRISLDNFSIDDKALLALETLIKSDINEKTFLSFSGRIPKGVKKKEVMNFLKALIQEGAHLVVDSNSFSLDDLKEMKPWFIKPNEQEVAKYTKEEVSDLVSASRMAAKLAKAKVADEVMISLGGDGAAWSDGERSFLIKVPKLDNPISTIGAGDSTIAGYLVASAQGLTKEEALKLAVSYGTASCLTEGTLPPLPSDIAVINKQVDIVQHN